MNTIALDTPTPRSRGLMPPLRTIAKDAAHLVLGLPVGIVAFTVIVTGLSLGAGLAVTLIGIPIVLATLLLARGIAAGERHRAALLLDTPIHGRERRLEGGTIDRARTLATDPASWRDVAWSVLTLPIGTAGFTIAVTLWSTALGLVTSPLWLWALEEDGDPPVIDDPGLGYSVLRVVIGVALVPVAAWGSRVTAAASGRLARALLG